MEEYPMEHVARGSNRGPRLVETDGQWVVSWEVRNTLGRVPYCAQFKSRNDAIDFIERKWKGWDGLPF